MALGKLMVEKGVSYVHFGTPCTAFSRARRNVRNWRRAHERERVACELAFFTAEAVILCHFHGIHWSIENPASSRVWDFPAIQELEVLKGVRKINFPLCQYGMDCKKPVTVMTNWIR